MRISGNKQAFSTVVERYNEAKSYRRDVVGQVKTAIDEEGRFGFLSEGKIYHPTKHMIGQLAAKTKWGSYTLNKLFNHHDEKAHIILKDLLDISFKENQDDEFLFRFSDFDDSARAFLSQQYAVINNDWVLETVKEFLPADSLDSVLRDKSGDDFLNFQVVVPSTMVKGDDSDYGGLIQITNSEIGTHRLTVRAGVYRSICTNGMIGWVDKSEISVVHRGDKNLQSLGSQIQEVIQSHILAMPRLINSLLVTKAMGTDGASMTPIFASIANIYKLSRNEIDQVHTGWGVERNETPQYAKTLFGVINSFTRAAQAQGEQGWNKFNELGGELAEGGQRGWDNIVAKSRVLYAADTQKILGEVVFV